MCQVTERVIDIIVFFIVSICVSLFCGFTIGHGHAKRQALTGYKAIGIYQTNNFGEIKLKSIEWKKQ